MLLLHGYRAGQWAVEERVWPVQWLFDKGLDVALPVFPFHAVRSRRRGAPLVPGSDPRMTNEGFRQAVLDVRTLAHHLLERGAPSVGVMGMSLGGYTAALTATVEDRLSFAVPIIPLSSIADTARDSGRLVGSIEEQRLQFEALEAAHRAVSPLSRPARLAREADPGRGRRGRSDYAHRARAPARRALRRAARGVRRRAHPPVLAGGGLPRGGAAAGEVGVVRADTLTARQFS